MGGLEEVLSKFRPLIALRHALSVIMWRQRIDNHNLFLSALRVATRPTPIPTLPKFFSAVEFTVVQPVEDPPPGVL